MRRLIPDHDPAKLMLRKERFNPDVTVSVGTPMEVLEHLLQNAGDAGREASAIVSRLSVEPAESPRRVEDAARVTELFVAIVESINAAIPRLASIGITQEVIQKAGAAFREEHGGYAKGYTVDDEHPEH